MKSALNLFALVALGAALFSATATAYAADDYGNSKTTKMEASDKKADKNMKAKDMKEADKGDKADAADAPKPKKKHHKKPSVSTEDPLAHQYMAHSDMDLWLHRECYNREHSWEYHLRHHSW